MRQAGGDALHVRQGFLREQTGRSSLLMPRPPGWPVHLRPSLDGERGHHRRSVPVWRPSCRYDSCTTRLERGAS